MRTFLVIAAVLLAASLALGGEVIRSRAVHRAFLKATGYPQGRPGFVADHIFPLCAGGRDAVDNLQWQSVADGKVKDRAEKQLCAAIRRLVADFDHQWKTHAHEGEPMPQLPIDATRTQLNRTNLELRLETRSLAIAGDITVQIFTGTDNPGWVKVRDGLRALGFTLHHDGSLSDEESIALLGNGR